MSSEDYHVVLLVEAALSEQDARQVHDLHTEIEGTVRYHVLLPVEDAAARIETSMGSMGTGEVMAAPTAVAAENIEELQGEMMATCREQVAASVRALEQTGASAEGREVTDDPIDALAAAVAELGAGEAIILTAPHVVAEFFHLDWSARARRALGVPVLHLLERENLDEQAEQYGDEGVTGV